MRWARIRKKIEENWTYVVYVLLAASLSFFGFKQLVPLWVVLVVIVFMAILNIAYNLSQKKSFKNMENSLNNLKKAREGDKEEWQKMNVELSNQGKYIQKIKKEKEASINIVQNLFDNGIISQEEIYSHMPSSDVYCLFCFPTTAPVIESGRKRHQLKRKYPSFLEKLGFVRTTKSSTVFLTTMKRLNPKFRNVRYLRDYIKTNIERILPKEWDEYLEKLKKFRGRKFKEKYYELKEQSHKNYLKFSFIIIRGKLNEKNVNFLQKERTYKKEIDRLLSEEIDFKLVDLPKEKKTKVREFMLDTSLVFFFYGFDKKVAKSIEKLEPLIKNKFQINNFLDYLNLSDNDIASVLEKEFSSEKSLKYAKELKRRINKHKRALKDLGISF